MGISLILLALASSALDAGASPPDGPLRMSASQIRVYNANLARSDPQFIRCTKQLETGSLVRKRATCRTNAEWRRVEDISNNEARDIADRVNTSGSSNSLEPAGSVGPLNGPGN